MELDHVTIASEGFTAKLKEAVENPPEETTEVVEAE